MNETRLESPTETDLGTAVHRVLEASAEPITLAKVRSRLPAPFRDASLEELADYLNRQVAANVVFQYPKYRSQHDRYWDRPMPVHVAGLLRLTLQDAPMAWSELRRKLPAYALPHAEGVLADQVAQGMLHRHPGIGKRAKERFAASPADAKAYLRPELAALFERLERLGFNQSQLRFAAIELLHDEEWGPAAPKAQQSRASSATGATGSAPSGELQALDQAELHPDSPNALSDSP